MDKQLTIEDFGVEIPKKRVTVEDVKEKYSNTIDDCDDGYIYCTACPMGHDRSLCTHDLSGYDECWEAIANFLNKDLPEQTEPKVSNNVEHPKHYNAGGIECIDAMESAFGIEAVQHFCALNAFKYIWRFLHKNGVEDVDKAVWYLNKYTELEAKKVHEEVCKL